jgi:hypothetical protein
MPEQDITEVEALRILGQAFTKVEASPACIRLEKGGAAVVLWIEGDGSRSWSVEQIGEK